MMAEDFWGDEMWDFAYSQFKRIFPDREPVELPLSHPIFHTVFDFKYLPQMPSAGRGYTGCPTTTRTTTRATTIRTTTRFTTTTTTSWR